MVDSIETGDRLFDSSRLRFASEPSLAKMQFEMVRIGGQIEAFLSLSRFRFPLETKIIFKTETEIFEELASVHEGGMRLRLSSESRQKVTQALQDGKKVAILVEDFEEVLDPRQFSPSYAQFVKGGTFLESILKGLVR